MKQVSLITLLLILFIKANAQSFEPILPPSPDVANIVKYVNQPVNMATGTPEISIPIYEIKTGQLSLPVSLSYHASGIKVNDNAGNVGLGWTLNAEGIITRSVMGKPDDGTYQTNGGPNWPIQMLQITDDQSLTLHKQLGQLHTIDGIPDLYTYRFGGYSGKFIIPQTGVIRLLPQKNIAISTTGTWPNLTWKIVADDGTQYFFSALETTLDRTATTTSNTSYTWYLTQMKSANNNDYIDFIYDNTGTYIEFDPGDQFSLELWWGQNIFTNTQSARASYSSLTGSGAGQKTSVQARTLGKQLKRIEFREGSITYDIDYNQRLDYSSGTVPRVKKVTVANNDNKIIKAVHFSYDYYNATSSLPSEKRLRLTGITMNASVSTGTALDQAYSFVYNSTPLPSKKSYAMDHWGYYNGATSNNTIYTSGTLIPSWSSCTQNLNAPVCVDCSDPAWQALVYQGANREPNATTMAAGILTKVVYPTGGSTEYVYEPHDVPPATPTYITLQNSQTNVSVQNTGSCTGGVCSASTYVINVPSTGLYANGLCATLSASALGPLSNPNWATNKSLWVSQAQCRVLIRESSATGAFTPAALISFDDSYDFTGSTPLSSTFTLLPGKTYFITAYSGWNGFSVSGTIDLKVPTVNNSVNRIIGGLRVKKINNYDQFTNKTTTTSYEYTNPATGFSSGEISYDPTYYDGLYSDIWTYIPADPDFVGASYCTYFDKRGILLTSNSLFPIHSGNHIYYSHVKKEEGANGVGGYSLNTFTTFSNFNPVVGSLDADWRRGLPIGKEVYDLSGAIKLKEENVYAIDASTTQQNVGFQVSFLGAHPCASSYNNLAAHPMYFMSNMYVFNSEWLRASETKVTSYYPGGQTIDRTTYAYSNSAHKQPTLITKYLSNTGNDRIETLIRYPLDYSVSSSSGNTPEVVALKELQDRHVHGRPIESISRKIIGSSTYAIDGNLVEYKINALGNVVQSKKYKLSNNPGTYTPVQSSIAAGAITKDAAYYLDASIVSEDSRQNVLELSTRSGDYSYLYAYDAALPVAKAQGAPNYRIAFSSFETSETGNWTYSASGLTSQDHITGKNSYNLSVGGTILSSNLGTTTVIVSYWKKSGTVTVNGQPPTWTGSTVNGWTYCEHKVILASTPHTGSAISISGTALIDELRLFPENAQLTTYNYDPLVGITSISDVAGKLSFFEYDDLGRLLIVRNQDGNIVKKHEYGTLKSE